MTAIFVTATGTDIGKTFVTAGLIRHYRKIGRAVEAIKPVMTGFSDEAPESSDAAVLLAALGRPMAMPEIERIAPWRFKAPLSPDMAARLEGRAIDFDELVELSRSAIASRSGVLLIEGIGGVMVPLDDRRTVLDWMSVLRIPVVLVAGTYVGTLSHTLTALEVVARRNIDITAVVVNESEQSAASLADTIATLQQFAGSIDIVGLPRLAADIDDHPAFADLARLL
ncbi:MAG: dethiobiotin synthase [Xanthobacteraceae bacterium]